MELVVTDKTFKDIGIIFPHGELTFGLDANDFELIVPTGTALPERGGLVYIEGTDIGGIVRGYDTTGDTPKILGDCWTGILDAHIVSPPYGQAYRVVNGEFNQVLQELIGLCHLDQLVVVSAVNSGITITNHTLKGNKTDSTQQDTGRYMSLWSVIWQLCSAFGAKLKVTWQGYPVKLHLEAMASVNYTTSEELPTSAVQVRIKTVDAVNHLKCLGKGELQNREVIDLFADEKGFISKQQTQFGLDAIEQIYDYSSSTDIEKDGRKKLAELIAKTQSVVVNLPRDTHLNFDLGDVVGGVDPSTAISASATVVQKTISLPEGDITYETKVR